MKIPEEGKAADFFLIPFHLGLFAYIKTSII